MRKGEDLNTHVVADIRLLKRFTDFRPEIGLEEGMLKTIEYYRYLLNGQKS